MELASDVVRMIGNLDHLYIGAVEVFDAAQFPQLINDAMRCRGIEFAGVRVGKSADVASVLDAGCLHSQTNSEVGDLLLAGIADRLQHPLDAALPETAGNEDA